MHRSRHDGGSGEEGGHDVEGGRGGMGQGGEEDGDGAAEGREYKGTEAEPFRHVRERDCRSCAASLAILAKLREPGVVRP